MFLAAPSTSFGGFGSQSLSRPKTPPAVTVNNDSMETSPVHHVAQPNPAPAMNGHSFFGGQSQVNGTLTPTTSFNFGGGGGFGGGAPAASTSFGGAPALNSRPGTPSSPYLPPVQLGGPVPVANGAAPVSPFNPPQHLHHQPPPQLSLSAPVSFNFASASPVPSPSLDAGAGAGGGNMFQFGAGVAPGEGSAAASPVTPRRAFKGLPRRGTAGRR